MQIAAVQQAIVELETEPYSEAIYDAAELLVEAGWKNARQLLDLTVGFDQVPAYALAALEGDAKRLAFLAVQRERHALLEQLQLAIANGDGVRELAAAIETTFAEGYHTPLIRDTGGAQQPLTFRRIPTQTWSTMVARTELSRAENAGAVALYRDAGVEKVRWSCANSETSCEECMDADDEVVDLGDAFPFVDVDAPPSHPNCVCAIVSADDFTGRDQDSQDNRDRASRGGYSAEEYEATFGHPHPIDAED
ncbi:MAG: phage minor head protein [Vulcanimicrobiaceae bacterium]|jgi:hypothetical protein